MPTSSHSSMDRRDIHGSVRTLLSVLRKNTYPSSSLVGVWTVWRRAPEPISAEHADRLRTTWLRRLTAHPWMRADGGQPADTGGWSLPTDGSWRADCPHWPRDIHQIGPLIHHEPMFAVPPATGRSE